MNSDSVSPFLDLFGGKIVGVGLTQGVPLGDGKREENMHRHRHTDTKKYQER